MSTDGPSRKSSSSMSSRHRSWRSKTLVTLEMDDDGDWIASGETWLVPKLKTKWDHPPDYEGTVIACTGGIMTLRLADGTTESLTVERPPQIGNPAPTPPDHFLYAWVSYDHNKMIFVNDDHTARVSWLLPILRRNFEKILADNGQPPPPLPGRRAFVLPDTKRMPLSTRFWCSLVALFNRMRDYHERNPEHRPVESAVRQKGSFIPQRTAIEQQLAHMLARPLFSVQNPMPAKVLSYLVIAALDGRTMLAANIQQDCYPRARTGDDPTRNARGAVKTLRTIVPEYYEGEGKDDPIVIQFPDPNEKATDGKRRKFHRGESYRPSFHYHPRNPLAKNFELVDELVAGSLAMRARGVRILREINGSEPNHPDAILLLAEAIGRTAMESLEDRPLVADLKRPALEFIESLPNAFADEWRYCNVLGLLYFVNSEKDKAEAAFARAFALDGGRTLLRAYYIHYLQVAGLAEKALELVQLFAERHERNAWVLAMHGNALFNVGRYSEAERVFTRALALENNSTSVHVGLSLLYREVGNEVKAELHRERVFALMEPEEREDVEARQAAYNRKE